ncbi:MAG: hypothetical protein AAFP04_11280 [Myxococcota bacterium]
MSRFLLIATLTLSASPALAADSATMVVRPSSEYLVHFLDALEQRRIDRRATLEDARRRRRFLVAAAPSERRMWERVAQLSGENQESADARIPTSTATN